MAEHQIISWIAAKQIGLAYYFTGKPCSRGHTAQRYVSGRSCLQCSVIRTESKKAKEREYYSRPEVRKARASYNKKWHAERVWTEEQKSRARAATAKWRKTNIERARELDRQYAVKHADKRRKYHQEYSRKNAAKLAAKERNKRAIKLRNGGTHTKEDVAAILKMQKGKCAYCRIFLKGKYHVDHIIPSAKGGGNGKENLQILCASCNHKKHARDPIEFAQSLGFLL